MANEKTTGRISVAVSKEMHMAARIYSIQNGETLAQVVVKALTLLLEKDKADAARLDAKAAA